MPIVVVFAGIPTTAGVFAAIVITALAVAVLTRVVFVVVNVPHASRPPLAPLTSSHVRDPREIVLVGLERRIFLEH